MFSAREQYRLNFLVLPLFGVLLLTTLSGCTLPWKVHHITAKNVNNVNVPRPSQQQLLAALQKNFRTVKSFHVVMEVRNEGSAGASQIQIQSADGDILMPDKIKAQAGVVLSGQSVKVNLISVGANQYITDPVTGQWRFIKGVLDPRTLTNPDTGIISLISKIHNVSEPTADMVNDVPCWRVQGQLDATSLAFLTGGGAPAGSQLQTSACVGKGDSLPYQVMVTGQAAPGDTPQTARIFTMSNYNESLTITAPAV